MKYNSKNAEHFDTEPYAKITDDEAADLLSQDQIDHLLESIEKSQKDPNNQHSFEWCKLSTPNKLQARSNNATLQEEIDCEKVGSGFKPQ